MIYISIWMYIYSHVYVTRESYIYIYTFTSSMIWYTRIIYIYMYGIYMCVSTIPHHVRHVTYMYILYIRISYTYTYDASSYLYISWYDITTDLYMIFDLLYMNPQYKQCIWIYICMRYTQIWYVYPNSIMYDVYTVIYTYDDMIYCHIYIWRHSLYIYI